MAIYYITVGVVFENVARVVEPVEGSMPATLQALKCYIPIVEDLAAQNMTTNPPAVGPSLLFEMVMAESLALHVIDLEARVVHTTPTRAYRTSANKEALGPIH